MRVVCNSDYIHFRLQPSSAQKPKAKSELKIGGFNVFHLGDNLTPYKNIGLVAEIIDQWDVVGVTEPMPLPTEQELNNARLEKLLSRMGSQSIRIEGTSNTVTAEHLLRQFAVPGYIQLLKALQKRDSSWSLLLSPEASGDSQHKELVGIFYRATQLTPTQVKYCRDKIACPARFSADVDPVVSRRPFVAGFRSGKFDFILLATHIRFRIPKDTSVYPMVLRQYNHPEGGVQTQKINEEVARYAEVKSIIDVMGKDIQAAGREKDVILVGDFNLEVKGIREKVWKSTLRGYPGAEVFVTEKTSVSPQGTLVSNYDHFVFNPSITRECDPKSAMAFDFTLPQAFDGIERFKQGYDKYRESYARKLMGELVINDKGKVFPRIKNEQELGVELAEFDQRMGDSSKPGLMAMNLISDHIPISMSCDTGRDDD